MSVLTYFLNAHSGLDTVASSSPWDRSAGAVIEQRRAHAIQSTPKQSTSNNLKNTYGY